MKLLKAIDLELKPIRISPHFCINDWTILSFSTENDWEKGIDIFEDRIRGRFLKPITYFETYKYAGFAVLALDCLLIETLQQFKKGVSDTPWGESESYFVDFLTKTSFKKYFDADLAKFFYRQIRCGVLHQAEIKGSSRVFVHQDIPLVKWSKDKKGLIINRKLFHNQLIIEFKNYLSQLKVSNPPDVHLRTNFRKKMNFICHV